MTARIAKTITAVAEGYGSDLSHLLDRSRPITSELVNNVLARSHCHFAGRRPRHPVNRPTDMDLASYLLTVYNRQAVVEIARYQRLTPQTETVDERHVGSVRFGKVIGLVSHREYLSFGIELEDVSVIGSDGYTEAVGRPRSFTILAPSQEWHVPAASLVWRERADEAAFNEHHNLTRRDIVSFAHPNRAESVMGAPYLHAKLLLDRLREELSHYTRPRVSSMAPTTRRYTDVASEIVPSFTMHVAGRKRQGSYPDIANHAYVEQLRRWRQLVQWLVRLDEYAFFTAGMARSYTAPWVRGRNWVLTGEGTAQLELHPNLVLSYKLRYVSRSTVAARVPLTTV